MRRKVSASVARVRLLHVHVQRNLVHEGFDADCTAVGSLLGVSPDVGFQVNLLREAFPAEGAAERFLPRVDPRVQLEALVGGEALFTDGALVVFGYAHVVGSHELKGFRCGSFKSKEYISAVWDCVRVGARDWIVSVSVVSLCWYLRG